MTTRRSASSVALVLCSSALLSACGWQGLNSLPLPGTAGDGPGSYEVVIEMPDVSTIERNARVLVGDVTVGRVADLALVDGHAEVTVRLDGSTTLPADAVASVGQTSLLGSTHIELAASTSGDAQGRLSDGDVIPLDRAGAYPTTEQTLSSLSLVLNGGGLARINDITTEVDAALDGNEESLRSVLAGLETLLVGLDDQKSDIQNAIVDLDRFAGTVAANDAVLGDAVTALAPALTVLSDRRGDLVSALDSLGRLGTTAEAIVNDTGDDLVTALDDLGPVLKSLADSGSSLTESFRYLLTYPFPIDVYKNAVRGDYANGEVTLDLRMATLDNALLLGTPFEGMLAGLEGAVGAMAPTPTPTLPTVNDLLLPPNLLPPNLLPQNGAP
ncbi:MULTISPECIES: MCE family protein [unclassified Rhodococcus (in: high G+C Gram-positive bacteria)]|uniref:MCE family protein n=1 Tax=unclassified Rhodococcus (in: high G+C Gram-positive bacteria) TaxID=192944 RepID=UPI0006FE3356|nr:MULTISPECIES: MCE family protein [unclassified Rhodococcus (in: high G+C Gram-positive bacteria)]KQU38494.1 mammalian cell entry protein [Rhodococcus sp. Leaf225]KQU39857.1 mammalian cell entry protein [Rhodococcus sp. Leaf258]